ncbi:MAG: hypothetical protein IJ083_02740 [Clostridia bacterium]|nr:hypothetical protein [Clostridia bacterium]
MAGNRFGPDSTPSWKEGWERKKKRSYVKTEYRPLRRTVEDQEDLDAFLSAYDPLSIAAPSPEARDDALEAETGALYTRSRAALEDISMAPLPNLPSSVLRLHLEIVPDVFFHEAQTLKSDVEYREDVERALRDYGHLRGKHISRDVIVPEDLPLYALHYLIMHVFGLRNLHMHEFTLPQDTLKALTGDQTGRWVQLIGILFRSPFMNLDDRSWGDDEEGRSFRAFLRERLTGPYGYAPSEVPSQACLIRTGFDPDRQYLVTYCRGEGLEEIVYTCCPLEEASELRLPETDKFTFRQEVRPFASLPVDSIPFLIKGSPTLLERLPVSDLLVPVDGDLQPADGVTILRTLSGRLGAIRDIHPFFDPRMDEEMDLAISRPLPCTRVLHYFYDPASSWWVRITMTRDCQDLVEDGHVTQEELDRAQVRVRELYQPAVISSDGPMLMEDLGGLPCLSEFLQEIHPDLRNMDRKERDRALEIRAERLAWAKKQGWRGEKPNFL